MRPEPDEQCSSFTWMHGDTDVFAIVYSRAWVTRLTTLSQEHDSFKLLKEYPDGAVAFSFPARQLKLRLPRKKRKEPVDEPNLGGSSWNERELAITFNERGRKAYVYTTDPVWARKLTKQGVEWQPDPPGVSFKIPKSAVKVYAPRNLSEDAKERLRNQLKRVRIINSA